MHGVRMMSNACEAVIGGVGSRLSRAIKWSKYLFHIGSIGSIKVITAGGEDHSRGRL